MTPAVSTTTASTTCRPTVRCSAITAIAGAGLLSCLCSPRRWATRPACVDPPASCSPARCRTHRAVHLDAPRRRSLGDLVKMEPARCLGVIALFGAFLIMVIILAVLALIVEGADEFAGARSPSPRRSRSRCSWASTRDIRPPHRRRSVDHRLRAADGIDRVRPARARFADARRMVHVHGHAAHVDPDRLRLASRRCCRWLLLAPRDYLSTFLKIGTILGLAIGILGVAPELKMPATKFVDGTGTVWSGQPVPVHHDRVRCRVGLPCADLVGHDAEADRQRNQRALHRLRRDADGIVRRDHGAGRRLRDRAGHLLRDERPAAVLGSTPEAVANTVTQWGFVLTPDMLTQTAKAVGETTIIARAARRRWPSAWRTSCKRIGGEAMMAFWYHFAILFEGAVHPDAVDAGTRAGRFMRRTCSAPTRRSSAPSRVREPGATACAWRGATSCVPAWSIRSAASTRGRCSASRTRCSPRSRWCSAPSCCSR